MPTTGGLGFEEDLSTWSRWWSFNREPFLLSDALAGGPRSGRGENQLAGAVAPEVIFERIVPRLRAILGEDPSARLRSAVLLSLARIGEANANLLGSSPMQELFVEHLAHGNRSVAEAACIALGVLGQPGSVSILQSLLEDDEAGSALVGGGEVSARQRAFAAYGLGLLGETTDNPDVRRYATHALVDALEREPCATSDDRVAAVLALGLIPAESRAIAGGACSCASNDGLAGRLLELFEDDDETDSVRAHVPAALARLAPHLSQETREAVVDTLLEALAAKREDRLVQQGCALALGRVGDGDLDPLDAKIRRSLIQAATSRRADLRHFATIALAEVAARPGDGAGGAWAGSVEVDRFLAKRLPRAKTLERAWLALSLGLLERVRQDHGQAASSDIGAALRESLRDARSADSVAAHAIASGLARDTQALAKLEERLAKVHGPEQGLAALGLGLTGSEGAIPALRETLRASGHEPAACEGATIAMTLARDGEVVAELQRLLDDCNCLRSRMTVATALGRTRDVRAVEPLLALLGDDDMPDEQRNAAVFALGRLAEKERLPWGARLSSGVNYLASTATLTSSEGAGILDVP